MVSRPLNEAALPVRVPEQTVEERDILPASDPAADR